MRKIHVQLTHSNRLRIRNRTFLQWITLLVAYWSVAFKPISYLPGALSYFKYVPDAVLFAMIILNLPKGRMKVRKDQIPVICIVIGFFFYALLVYLIRYQSAAYFLWGFRNNFRFYIAFFAFITYLDEIDVEGWFKTMDVLFWINVALSAVQFFVLGIKGDFLGGIFGILGASNGYTLCFMSIVITVSLLKSFSGQAKLMGSMARCVAGIVVAVMAEMRFFFFLLLLLMVAAAIMTNFSLKKCIYIGFGVAVLVLGASVLADIFEFEGFFSLRSMWKTATLKSYSSSGDVNRLTAIASVIERLDLTLLEQMFGFGLGNCDTSAFAICNTPFFQQHGYMHYHWFISSMVFLETGYTGLIMYALFIFACFMKAYRLNKSNHSVYAQLAMIISGVCFILIFYDSSLRIESGYMMYFVLALPFIGQDSARKESESMNLKEKEVR